MTQEMHKGIAVILCALIKIFPNYANHINELAERKKMVGNWSTNDESPTTELISWCKLQWRRRPCSLIFRTKQEEAAKGVIRLDRDGPCAGDFANAESVTDLDKVILNYETYISTMSGSTNTSPMVMPEIQNQEEVVLQPVVMPQLQNQEEVVPLQGTLRTELKGGECTRINNILYNCYNLFFIRTFTLEAFGIEHQVFNSFHV